MPPTSATSEQNPNAKVSKKDRHVKGLYELSKFLENVNENTVQEVLLLTRNNRETLEDLDLNLNQFCQRIDDDKFLLDKWETDLLSYLDELKFKILEREQLISKFSLDLDQTEVKRACIVGAELKVLVDKLIGIGYQLPDDIERLVENEAFEINKEVIKNRVTHSQTIAELQIKHVRLEFELLERWEATRRKWRQLRHDQALNIFRNEIRSDFYNDPDDRKNYMRKFRDSQKSRRSIIAQHLTSLSELSYSSITSEKVQAVQNMLNNCNEDELSAIQDCFNGLTQLRSGTDYQAKERVENIRRELHVYGALKVDPKLGLLAKQLQDVIDDSNLADLWRLGGGLKPDFQSIVSELTCDEIIYDRVVNSMEEKMELIIGSFSLKDFLVEKGRLSQLEKVRGMITKMRSAPRGEIATVLSGAIPDFLEIGGFQELPAIFRNSIETIVSEIKQELEDLEKRIVASSTPLASNGGTKQLGKTNLAATKTVALEKTNGKTSAAGKTLGTTKGVKGADVNAVMTYVDPVLVKNWHRKLAILFYGSDIPENYQKLCLEILSQVKDQRECNGLVDEVVSAESDKLLVRMDSRYRKLIDKIIAFLENQANILFTQTSNIGDYFLKLAKTIEKHRSEQKRLDDKSADEIWDISEEARLDHEDKEATYEAICQKIRESTKQEEINNHFQDILNILESIQQGYRDFHQNSCFAADRYSVYMIDEFRSFIMDTSRQLNMLPDEKHEFITQYDQIFDRVERLNKVYFDKDPMAAGVERVSLIEQLQAAQGEEYTTSNYIKDSSSEEVKSSFSGSFHLIDTMLEFCGKFSKESSFKEVKEEEDETSAQAAPKTAAVSIYSPHKQCPWMKSDSAVLPLPLEATEAMDPEDLFDYEVSLAKGFMQLSEGPSDPSSPASPFVSFESLSETEKESYRATQEVVNRVKERQSQESSPEFIRANLPCDAKGEGWIITAEVSDEELSAIHSKIRESIILNLEIEACDKLKTVETSMTQKKAELTDQLEDRVRNHWPRRGRVETEIKQPREAELLGHKDKTWRMIQNIQNKTIDLHHKFDQYLSASSKACSDYVENMTSLKDTLNGSYKNLAVLQGFDVKARNATLDFQADAARRIVALEKFTAQDVETIIVAARDFRRYCPAQVQGQQGGYSESELTEIEALVEGQCSEIRDVAEEWKRSIAQLCQEQEQSLKCQDEFTTKYNKCTQEVAMAEGLGQKYGAPRRRAQERIRSEVSRDERHAGKVDEFLAQIEFISSEIQIHRLIQDAGSTADPNPIDASDASSALTPKDGRESVRRMNFLWLLLKTLKEALVKRVAFLNVSGEQGAPAAVASFPWLDDKRISGFIPETDQEPSPFVDKIPGGEEVVIPGQIAQLATIEAVFEDVNSICRKETKQLYESEGLGKMLGPSGVPESLDQWLHEAKDKLLGRHGYRERAWKRLWSQFERLDLIFARYRNMSHGEEEGKDADADLPTEEAKAASTTTGAGNTLSKGGKTARPSSPSSPSTIAQPSSKISVQTSCIQFFVQAFISFAHFDWKQQLIPFEKLLQVWEKGREKHERLLRPRLGSPDKVDELNELEKMELGRSEEMIAHVLKFRSALIRGQMERFRVYCEDVGSVAKSMVLMLDAIWRQELISIPPDTAIPKKHMTLKKLRKAQRIREEVARGGSDRSVRRIWPGILLSETAPSVRANEDMVGDLGQDPFDTSGGAEAAAVPTDNKKAPPPKKGDKNAPPPTSASPPSILPAPWIERLAQSTEVDGLVSSAHRIVIDERNNAVLRYVEYLQQFFASTRDQFDTIIKQEQSWSERWKRQVNMLRKGDI